MRTIINLPNDRSVEILDPDEGQDTDGNAAWEGRMLGLYGGKSVSVPDTNLEEVCQSLVAALHDVWPSVSWNEDTDEKVINEIAKLFYLYDSRLAEERRTWRLTIEVNRDRRQHLPEAAIQILKEAGFEVNIMTY
jgi:hypothetical protein